MSIVSQQYARPGRAREIGLLILALAISFAAWTLVNIGVGQDPIFTQQFLIFAGSMCFIAVFGHVLIRFFVPWADPVVFPVAVLLNGIGVAMIHRIDFSLINQGGSAQVNGQLVLSGIGIALMVATVIALRDHRRLRRYTYVSLIFGIILLVLPLAPVIGREIYGARLWINIAGFSFQPAELAKICFVVFFSGYLVVQRDNLALAGKKICGIQFPQLRHFLPILIAWISCLAILAFENDFGTALLFFGLFIAMLYVATERISWIIIGGLLSIGGVWGIIKLVPHVAARFTVWLHALDPEVYDAQGGSYQIVQGLFGMASGGLFGTGWGEGFSGRTFAANSDFIIASLGEEIGLTGLLALLCIYLIFVSRALSTGIHLRDGFGKLMACGFGFTIALQSFVVVGGITRVIPLTGLAMPFLALGGSALLSNWIIVGILLRMSDDARRPLRETSRPLATIDTDELERIVGSDVSADDSAQEEPGSDSYPTEVVKL